jgi:hypothetical protein
MPLIMQKPQFSRNVSTHPISLVTSQMPVKESKLGFNTAVSPSVAPTGITAVLPLLGTVPAAAADVACPLL